MISYSTLLSFWIILGYFRFYRFLGNYTISRIFLGKASDIVLRKSTMADRMRGILNIRVTSGLSEKNPEVDFFCQFLIFTE